MNQGLPVNFENTASTWQNMPGMAALYTGLQNQAAQDNIRMLQDAFAKEQAFKDQQRPVELNNLVGAGKLQDAQALNYAATARHTGLQSDELSSTMPGKVSATNAENKFKEESIPYKKLAEQGKVIGDLSAYVANPSIPDFLKVQQVSQIMGGSPQDYLPVLPKLSQILKAESDHRFKLSDNYRITAMKEAGDSARNAATNATQVKLEGMRAERDEAKAKKRQEMQDSLSERLKRAKGAAQTNTIYREYKAKAMANNDSELANYYQSLIDANKQQEAIENAGGAKPVIRPNPDGTMTIIPGAQGAYDFMNHGASAPPTQNPGMVLGDRSVVPASTQKHSLADVQKMYPGVSVDKLKQAYKEKFGVDLQ